MAEDRPTAQRRDELKADSPMQLLERRRVIGRRAMVAQVAGVGRVPGGQFERQG